MWSSDKLKLKFKSILALNEHPARISAGFAVGVFISFTPPVPGVHTVVALALAFMFRLNKLTCISGSLVNSPLTVAPSMILAYKLGASILGTQQSTLNFQKLDWQASKTILVQHSAPLMLGCSIIAFFAAVSAYFICYRLIVLFRKKDATLAEKTREMEIVGEELE